MLEQMVHVVDRLIVDSSEWDDLPGGYAELAKQFDQTAVSDIAFRRSLRWRAMLAELWPGIADVKKIAVTGPKADALLLAGLAALPARPQDRAGARGGGRAASPSRSTATPSALRARESPDPSQLLSAELDQFGRDPIYEAAVRAAT